MKIKLNPITALLLSIPLIGCGSGSNSDKSDQANNQLQQCKISSSELTGNNTSDYWCAYVNSRDQKTSLMNSEHGFSADDVLADFSYAGYNSGETALPDTSKQENYVVYNVVDYGATPDDAISDKAAIKAVVAQIVQDRQANPNMKPAMIHFPAGQFIVNNEQDMVGIDASLSSAELAEKQPIFINIDNVVIRGEGDKTVLFMKQKLLATDPAKLWSIPFLFQVGAPSAAVSVSAHLTGSAAAFSSKTVTLDDASGFSVGDSISLTSMVKEPSKIADAISPYKLEKTQQGTALWSNLASGLIRTSKHTITAVDGNNITLNSPVPHDIGSGDNWIIEKRESYTNIGVENLVFRGNWQDSFSHHGSAEDDGAYSLLALKRVHNSWVRNVKFIDTNRAMELVNGYNVTNENITISGNPGHSAISISTSNNILSKNIKDYSNSWHASGVSKYTTTSVYLNSDYSGEMNIDLHGEQSVNNLFDNVKGGWAYGHWGASSKNQPNHLKGLVFWNSTNTSTPSEGGADFQNYMFMNDQSDYGRIIMPYIIGLQGQKVQVAPQSQYMQKMVEDGKAEYESGQLCNSAAGNTQCSGPLQAHVESNGVHVYPQSLYQAQLALRLKSQ